MSTKQKIISSSFIATLVVLLVFIPLRSGNIEKEYINSIISYSDSISYSLKRFEEGEILEKKNLSKFLNIVKKKYSPLALVIIADKGNRIIITAKNEKYIQTNKLFNRIIDSFTGEEYKINKNRKFLIRYYNQIKYYFFLNEIREGVILMVFPSKMTKNLFFMLSMEIFLIIIISIALATSIYLFSQKTEKIENNSVKIINLLKINRGNKKKNEKIITTVENVAVDSLNNYIYEFYNNISSIYNPDIISLYIISNDACSLKKIFEFKGKVFLTIDSDNFNIIDLHNDIGEELKRSSMLILEKSKKIILPIIYKNSLLGALCLIRDKKFLGKEINDINSKSKDIAKHLSEYLLLTDVVVDKETGLFSKSYFNLKYDEQRKLLGMDGKSLSIILLSIFEKDSKIEITEQNLLIKAISPKIIELIKEDNIICRFDEYLAILSPNVNFSESTDICSKILESLSGKRYKISKKHIYEIKIFFGIASTDNLDENEDPVNIAIQNLRYAQTKHESNIQSTNHCANNK